MIFLHRFNFSQFEDGSTDWQVVLGTHADDPFNKDKPKLHTQGPMTPKQAEAAGFPIDKVIEGLNTQTMDDLVAERAKSKTAELKAEAAEQQLAIANRDLANLRRQIDEAATQAETKAAALRAAATPQPEKEEG